MTALEFQYDESVKKAATDFMLQIFADPKLSNQVSEVAINAAMTIINGHTFYQPETKSQD